MVGFGSKAVQLTPFTQSTAEADDALRLLKVDSDERHGALRRAAALRLLAAHAARPRPRRRPAHRRQGRLEPGLAAGGARNRPRHRHARLPDRDRRRRRDRGTASADGEGDRRQLQVGRHQRELGRGLLVDRERAEADLARRVRHLRAAGREAPPPRGARPRGRCVDQRAHPGQLVRGRRRQRAAEPALLTAGWATAHHAGRVPRAHCLWVRARLDQGLVGQDPPRPACRGLSQDAEAPEGRAARCSGRALPRDRAGVRPPADLAQAPAQARAGRPAAAHGRVRLPDRRLRRSSSPSSPRCPGGRRSGS